MILLGMLTLLFVVLLARWLKPWDNFRITGGWRNFTVVKFLSAILVVVLTWWLWSRIVRWLLRHAHGDHGWAKNEVIRFGLIFATSLVLGGWFFHYVSTAPRRDGEGD